jgi:hypothetical protein
MEWRGRCRATGAACFFKSSGSLLAATCALMLAGCNPDNQALSAAQPRGATVAFESVDGLPPGQFRKLVQDLNDEAQSRHLAVTSREQASAYRVRGYLAIKLTKHQTTITWVWDVFDQDEQRTLRISGEETAKGRRRDAWAAADDAMLGRIARASMEQLAAFLTSPEVAPGTAPSPTEPQVAMTNPGESSPEAAGIFRISHAQADPDSTGAADAAPDDRQDGPVPLPSRRPGTTMSARDTLTMAARSH